MRTKIDDVITFDEKFKQVDLETYEFVKIFIILSGFISGYLLGTWLKYGL